MAQRSAGTQLQLNSLLITEVNTITLPQQQADTIDVTDLSITDRYKRFIASWIDAGELTFDCFLNTTAAQLALFTQLQNGGEIPVQIILPATLGISISFSGIVTSISSDINTDDAIKLSVTVKVTGAVTVSTVASAGLTSLVLAGTGTMVPAYTAATTQYAYTGMTAGSFTITPTLSTLINGKLYVNGAYSQDFSSGAVITGTMPTAPSSREFLLTYNEAGKSSVAYRIVATRAS